jgi:hypothetical protein
LIAVAGAVLAISMTAAPAFATTNESYRQTISFYQDAFGQCQTFHGTAIHIQLTTYSPNGGNGGRYTISVYRCSGGRPSTLVGSAASCGYVGFCGYGWPIALNGYQYAFYFNKTAGDWHDIVACDASHGYVQTWSTS